MIQPRPYQTEALKKILKRWREGITRQLVSLPTGTGTTSNGPTNLAHGSRHRT